MRTLETTGMPAGLLEQATYTIEELRMFKGDKLVLFRWFGCGRRHHHCGAGMRGLNVAVVVL